MGVHINPVNWYPWDKLAFKEAKAKDKPIFLSIGYSTCHWCHVMEKESFEDIEVARLMNETFISIKVDREERPDIDKIYMEFCQMLTGSGGWPLTIIMTPEKKPFFAATYIPKQNKYGRIGMLELISQVKDLWLNKRNDIQKSSENITQHFLQQNVSIPGKYLNNSILDLTFDRLSQLYDSTNGGFGKSPKFPTVHHIYFLLRYWKRNKNDYALKIVEKTLSAMRHGGIWDHIGFGFHRYSTDEKWIIPHFEKMLYDQALAAIGFIEAYQVTKNEEYKSTAEEIFTYVKRDMTSAYGGFYSAEDADSEGIEGKFYTWTKDEIQKIFSKQESDMVIDIFNIGISSLEHRSILYINKTLEDIALKYNLSLKDLKEFIQDSIKKMFYERKKRIHPFKDDKILTDWNGLMISAFAKGARVFNSKAHEKAASDAADFIINNLITKDGQLLHRFRDGQAAIEANLDDYAFFVMGLLELYEATFNILYLKTAKNLNEYLINNFYDNENGGFYFTKINDIVGFRKKDIYDGAIPSGNSIALLNLIKLSRVTADNSFEDKAFKLLKAFSGIIKKSPEAYTQLISSFDFMIGPSFEIVVVGDLDSYETKKIISYINSIFAPNKVVILKTFESEEPEIIKIARYAKDLQIINDKPTIYICTNFECKSPTNNIKDILKVLT